MWAALAFVAVVLAATWALTRWLNQLTPPKVRLRRMTPRMEEEVRRAMATLDRELAAIERGETP